jgi:malate dehydrogenase
MVMPNKSVNVAITGAAGAIGYSLVFRVASGQMFGPNVDIHLSLLELEMVLPALKGVVMELDDCAFPLLKSVSVNSDPRKAFSGCDWALLVGSVPRKEGMERSDLLKINGRIFIEQGRALSEAAKPTCKVLVVGNPCNTNAYIAKESCKNIPAKNFFAMTMLDQNRAYAQIAQKAGVGVDQIGHLAIWGNHSTTQFPDFYHATISGKPALKVIGNEEWFKKDFLEAVQKRGAAVIKARGASSAASAANAVIDTVRHLVNPTPKGEFFSVALTSDGSYGIEKGLIFSFPVCSKGDGCEIVQKIEHNAFGLKKIAATHEELKSERDAVKELLM